MAKTVALENVRPGRWAKIAGDEIIVAPNTPKVEKGTLVRVQSVEKIYVVCKTEDDQRVHLLKWTEVES